MKRAALICAAAAALIASAPAEAAPTTPLGHSGRWITDATGRVVLLHGVNMVYKRPPYYPAAAGFDAQDADFLAANGFNTVRLGLIYAGVEPSPGVYDEAYLDQIAATESLLASRGIFSQLDFHQDLYNERFQGEGWPDWAVQDDGLPATPQLGFPANYFGMTALLRAFDHFWANDPGPGGVGLQDRYAAAFRHVAARFASRDHTIGYDIMNEPWPGTPWVLCANPVGCPAFDQGTLAPFHSRVRNAIRQVEGQKLVWYEPNVLFNFGVDSQHPATGDAASGFSFHVYCLAAGSTPIPGLNNLTCAQTDELAFQNADKQAAETGDALLLSEFGATNDLDLIFRNIEQAEKHMVSWQYWHYCDCNDPTTSGPGVQGVVLEANQPPIGTNLRESKLGVLVRPYPQLVAGTPVSYDFDPAAVTFKLSYLTSGPTGVSYRPADGEGPVPASTPASEVFVPERHFPQGYEVDVEGGGIASKPNDRTLKLVACPGTARVNVTVRRPGTAPVDGPDCAVRGVAGAKLRMKLRPRRATVGKRRCFRATVRTDNGSLVQQARFRIGERSKLTDDRGRARICRSFGKTGKFKATAKKLGFVKAKKKIRVKQAKRSRGKSR